MKRWFCFVLALVLTAMLFAGCGEKKKLLGTWECTVDLTGEVQALLDELPLGGDHTARDFRVKAVLEFGEDDRFRLQLDAQDLAQRLNMLVAELEEDLMALLQTQLGEKLEIPLQEVLDKASIDEEALTGQLRAQFPVEELREKLETATVLSGSYKVKKDKLLLGPDEDSLKIVPGIPYVLEGDVLQLALPEVPGTFTAGNRILEQLPLEFIRR